MEQPGSRGEDQRWTEDAAAAEAPEAPGPEAPEEGPGGFAGLEEPPPAESPEPRVEEDPLEGLQAELEALNDRHLRLAAEFDNYRKRAKREREEIRLRGEADLVAKLLDPLDDLLRVAAFEQEGTVESLLEGVRLVEKKLRRVLEGEGLEPIQAEGEFFNPETMEAIMTAPAEHPEEDDVVDQVFQRGYRFHGSLVRPARVRVKKYEG